jgi:hypothetical protein
MLPSKSPLLILLFTFISFSVFAQTEETGKRTSAFYFTTGYQNTSPDAFNQSWQNGLFADASGSMWNIGFGQGYFYDRLMFNWEFQSLIGRHRNSAQYSSRLSSGDFVINLGYMVLNNEKQKVYPTIGAGLGGAMFQFESRNPQINDPLDLLSVNSARINNIFIPLPIALNADISPGKNNRFVLGLSAGYNWAFVVDRWRYGNQINSSTSPVISGLNDFTNQGFFVRLKLGFLSGN